MPTPTEDRYYRNISDVDLPSYVVRRVDNDKAVAVANSREEADFLVAAANAHPTLQVQLAEAVALLRELAADGVSQKARDFVATLGGANG